MQHIESSPKFSKLAVYPLLLPSEHIAPLEAELIEVLQKTPINSHAYMGILVLKSQLHTAGKPLHNLFIYIAAAPEQRRSGFGTISWL